MKILLGLLVIISVYFVSEISADIFKKPKNNKCPIVTMMQGCKQECMDRLEFDTDKLAGFMTFFLTPGSALDGNGEIAEEILKFLTCILTEMNIVTVSDDGKMELQEETLTKLVIELGKTDSKFLEVFEKGAPLCMPPKCEGEDKQIICVLNLLDKACGSTLFLDVLVSIPI